MSQYKAINLRRTRDFGEKLNATIEFIRENFVNLFKSVLFIVGPVILLLAVVSNYYQNIMLEQVGLASDPSNFGSSGIAALGFAGMLTMFVSILSYAVSITVINEYVVLYLKKKTNQISPAEVWERVKKDAVMIMLSTIVVFVFVVIGTIFFVIPGIYLGVLLSLIYIVQINERLGFFAAMSRCSQIISGKWWSTFGILFVTAFIAIILTYAVVIPFSFFSIFSVFTDLMDPSQDFSYVEPSLFAKVISIISSIVFMLAAYTMQIIPIIGIAFQYFNLVERKESVGLMEKIEDFGNSDTPVDTDEHEDY